DSAATPAGDDVLTNGIIRRDVERTRERADELLYGELSGPMEAIRGERPERSRRADRASTEEKVRASSTHILRGDLPVERYEDPIVEGQEAPCSWHWRSACSPPAASIS